MQRPELGFMEQRVIFAMCNALRRGAAGIQGAQEVEDWWPMNERLDFDYAKTQLAIARVCYDLLDTPEAAANQDYSPIQKWLQNEFPIVVPDIGAGNITKEDVISGAFRKELNRLEKSLDEKVFFD